MTASGFEREVWEAARGCRLWEGPPNLQNPERNQRYADRLEAVSARLEEVQTKYQLGNGAAGHHVTAAREHLKTWAQGLREYPLGSMREQDIKTGHLRVEGSISRAVEAHRGVKPVPFEVADKLDRIFDSVLKAGDLVKFGKTEEALKTVDQVLNTAKNLRTVLARQAERGMER